MKKLIFLLVFCALALSSVWAQKTFSGTVLGPDGLGLPGVSVVEKGNAINGVSTDIDGKWTLTVPSDESILVFTSIGMKTIEMAAKNAAKLTMKNDAQVLGEVMVVAYGTTTKEAFTGSAAVMKNEELAKHVTTNVASSLAGSVPGLQLRGGSGQPGADSGNIKIRGISSLYAGQNPLVIVDGAPYPSSLSNIPQSDIESVSVLKDAASAALYGARGASGVILITTKKGKTRDAIINVDAKWGVNSRAVQDYDVIDNPGDYYEAYYSQLYNKYYYNDGLSAADANLQANNRMIKDLGYNVYTLPSGQQLIGMNGKLNPNATLGRKYDYDGSTYYMQPDNWKDMAYNNALRQEYTISANAANDRGSFYASLGYLDEGGIIEHSSYNRMNSRIKADYQLKDWLKVGANMGFVNSKQKSNPNMSSSALGSTNLMYYTSRIAPIYPVYVRTVDKAGNPIIKTDQYGNQQYDYGVPATNYGVARPFMATGNPLGSNKHNESLNEFTQLNGSLFANIDITSFLKFNARSTIIWGETHGSYYDNPFYGPKAGVKGELLKTGETSVRTNNLQTLTYQKDFEQHNLKIMLGHEYYLSQYKYLDAKAQGGFSPDIKEINAFAKKADASSYSTNYNVEGFFGSAEYNYETKYYASLSFRRDASSKFAKDQRWGNFWSIGSAWVLSKENFLKNKDWIDMLKLKFSLGQQGNDNIKSFAYTDTYTLSKASDTSMSPSFSRVGNANITWETTTNINAGLEFSLWSGRLSGNVDVYSKKTTDLLFWMSIPESSGSRGYYGNVGDIRNSGVEFVLNGAVIRNNDFEWDISFNFSHNKTKILSLPKSKTADNGGFFEKNQWYSENGELYNRMTYAYAGVNEKGEALYYYDEDLSDLGNSKNNITNKPGKKRSGTTTEIGHASRYTTGSTLPDLFGGFGTALRWKNFDASVTFDYQIGGKIYDRQYAALMFPSKDEKNAGANFHKDWIKAWSPNNTKSNIPRWQYGDKSRMTDRFLTSASYLNFQSFSLGYTLPENLIKGISKVRVYVAGENLMFWSAREGLDPRYSYSETETINQYSPVRNISGGIQLTF